ncbi:hypothetical protein C4585_00925 [Candidatus Parcubacteria bacterium]|nr:MAG: hypothetical protein C4585_00925 [Candidatus Parcubacteria bacterium]
MDPAQGTQQEIYRLVKENNAMLHKMRRNAFWGGVIKFVLYVVFIVVIPYWLYMTYLAPIVDSTLQTVEQIQGTSANAQLQLESLQQALQQFDLSQYFGR